MFAALSRRLPADGGPYAYARVAFGNRVGFFNAWSYWISAWAGNAGIAVGWVLYVEVFINKGHHKLITILLVLVGLWIPAVINLSGVKNMGSVQMVTTVLKFAALAVPASYDAPSYAVVMTGHFASYRGGTLDQAYVPPAIQKTELRRRPLSERSAA